MRDSRMKGGNIIPPRHGGAQEADRIFGTAFAGREFLDFSISINPLGPPPGLLKVLIRVLEKIPAYPESDARTLVEELASFHGHSSRYFIAGNGSTDLLFSLVQLLPNRRAIIPYPSFIEYERICEIYGWHILHVPPVETTRFAWDPEAILENLTPGATLFICQPNNPTGQSLEMDDLEKILQKAERLGTFVILDEAFLPFTERPSMIPRVSRYSTLIVLRSMTKTYGIPGLRLGYAAASPAIVDRWRRCLPPWNVNILAQEAGVYCLRQGGDYLERSKRFIREERERLSDGINRLHFLQALPSEANFFLVILDQEVLTADELYLFLGKQGILVRHCGSFRGMGKGHVRVGVKGRNDNDALLTALRKIGVQDHFTRSDFRSEATGVS